MNVNHEHKTIWWLPPRTATRSASVLLAYYNFHNAVSNTHVNDSYDLHRMGIPSGCEDYLIVCSVRNPFAYIVSQWHWRCFHIPQDSAEPVITMTFPEYLRQIRGISELYEAFFVHKRRPDVFFRIENYMEDLKKIPFVNLEDPNVKEIIHGQFATNQYLNDGNHVLKRNPKDYRLTDWRSYYQNEEELDIVRKECKILFDECGYDPYEI